MTIGQYFEQTIFSCELCRKDPQLETLVTYEKLLPFVGSQNIQVLLIGHSPKVRTSSKISVTLDLTEDRQLRRYIENEVLQPLGLGLQHCVATNLVKCLTDEMPEDMSVNGVPFMQKAFEMCKVHLIRELEIIRPKLLISFSQQVSDLLQKNFVGNDEQIRKMKDIFATLRQLPVEGKGYSWIPVVHIPKGRVRAYYFPEQTMRLERLRNEVEKLLSQP